MKAKFFLFLFLVLYASKGFSQAENRYNYFGQYAGLDFTTSTPTVVFTSAMQTFGGACTVSDRFTGQLLFYTNGDTFWDRNNQVMSNSNPLSFSGSFYALQGGLIVPSLSDSNKYYAFSLPSGSSGQFSYSLVDMALNNGLGDVVSTENNVPMLNENHNPFTLRTGGIAVAQTRDGAGYWVLYPNNNKLYAYKIDGNGIDIMNPVVTTLNFTNDQTNTTSFLSCIKVSPDNTRLGISYTSPSIVGNLNANSQMRIYLFDNSTGTVDTTSNEIDILNRSIYSFEFNSTSNLVFINNTWGTGSVTNNCRLLVYDLVNNINREELIPLNSGNNRYLYYFERAVNNDIYIHSTSTNGVCRITDPSNYNSSISYNIMNLNSQPDGVPRTMRNSVGTLVKSASCRLNLNLAGTGIYNNYSYQVSNRITTENNFTVNSGQNVNLYSNNFIEFKANTHLRNGSTILAKIQPCPTPSARIASENTIKNIESFDTISELVITPNPATDFVSIITRQNLFNKITIVSLDGKLIKSNLIENTNEYSIDVSDLSKGIYLISVTSKEGNVLTQKLVKN